MLRRLFRRFRTAALCAAAGMTMAAPAAAETPVATASPGAPTLMLGGFDGPKAGYAVEEYFVSGNATSYAASGPLAADGAWDVKPAGVSPYRTRVVVIRPQDPARFNGTVLVEWLNVSGGLDTPADWFMGHREIVRSGYAYVAVTAQKVGVDGGPSLGADMSLKKVNPARYGDLSHPGDAFAFDIFSQAGRLIRQGAVMGPLQPKQVLALGESQSAHFLTTYLNAVDPIAQVYDGFLVHSRFGGSAPLDGASMIGGPPIERIAKFRPDLRKPVLTVITETDLIGGPRIGYYGARQPDSANLRTWEIAGTAHADNYTLQIAPIDNGDAPIETLAAAYAPTTQLMGRQLAKPINSGPQHHYVIQAAISSLDQWVRSGRPPASAPLLEVAPGTPPVLAVDAHGIARGGIRSPWVDVPTMRLSGAANPEEGLMASLFGTSEPFDAAQLAKLYPGGKADYLKRFNVSLEAAIRDGYILAADKQEILALADAMYPKRP